MCWYHCTAQLSAPSEQDLVVSATCFAPSSDLFRSGVMQAMQSQNHVAGLKEGADVATPASTSQLVAPAQKQIRCVPCTAFVSLHHMHHRVLM